MSNLPFILHFCPLPAYLSSLFPSVSSKGSNDWYGVIFPGLWGPQSSYQGLSISAVEGDSRILMGLFYQRAAGPCFRRRQGETERDRQREGSCLCVRLIIVTPPSDSVGEVPCQMIQHRLLSFPCSRFLVLGFHSLSSLFFSPFICHLQTWIFIFTWSLMSFLFFLFFLNQTSVKNRLPIRPIKLATHHYTFPSLSLML